MSLSKTLVQPDARIAIDSTNHPEDSQLVRVSAEDMNVGKGLGTLRVRNQTIDQKKSRIKDRYRTLLQGPSVFEVFRGNAFL